MVSQVWQSELGGRVTNDDDEGQDGKAGRRCGIK